MQSVQPFASLDDLKQAIDNGGRFYHLFTKAGDHLVSKAELAKAAGVFSSDRRLFLFLELAWRDLSEGDRDTIVAMLEPSLRERYDEMRPTELHPSQVESDGEAGVAVIIDGWPRFAREKLTTVMIPIMVGTVVTMMPIQQRFQVYEVYDSEDHTGVCALATMPVESELIEATPTRFAGFLRNLNSDDEHESAHQIYLETVYFSDLPC